MSMNDPLGDMLTRIRNAQLRGKSTVSSPASKLRAWVLDVLADEGYIRGYEKNATDNGQGELVISLNFEDIAKHEPCRKMTAKSDKTLVAQTKMKRSSGFEKTPKKMKVNPEN